MPPMISATAPAKPENERERLEALARYRILDTPPEQAFDDLALLASQICGTPIAVVSLVDADRQWCKARVNFADAATARDTAFCAHAILGRDLLVVPDAAADPRFAESPIVAGEPGIRFYAGAPLVTDEGYVLGTLCVMDRRSRGLTPDQAGALRALSRRVVSELELKRRIALEREDAGEFVPETEEAPRMVLSQMPVIFWSVDRELRFTEAMGAGRRLFEGPPGAVVGTSLFAYFKTTDAAFEPIAAHRRALEGESTTYEMPSNGRVLQAHLEPLRESDGTIHGVLGIAFDITEHKNAEEALRRSLSLLSATIDSTADAILVVDTTGRLVHFNRRFVAMWAIPESVVESGDDAGALASVLAQLADPAAFVQKVMPGSAPRARASHDLLELKDGRLIERDSLPQVADGRTVGRVWSFRDVTERRRVEEGVEQSLSLHMATLEATADGV
ncbi:MAG TPA: PAS domain-containing protein, partial [Thermoanaerobaculia bacterium]